MVVPFVNAPLGAECTTAAVDLLHPYSDVDTYIVMLHGDMPSRDTVSAIALRFLETV